MYMQESNYELSHADRLVGIPSEFRERQKDIERSCTDYWFYERGGKTLAPYELEKTERDSAIIHLADQTVARYLAEHGRQKNIVVPLKNVHVLHDGGVVAYTEGRTDVAAQSPTLGSVIVDRVKSDMQFTLIVFHELFHMKSYVALQITHAARPEERDFQEYRLGIRIKSRDGTQEYFVDLDEAIVAFMTQRFYEEIVSRDPMFEDERTSATFSPPKNSREEERQQLNEIIDQLWEKNRQRFTQRSEILDLFFDAHVRGRLLPLARLIESSFGKGSFRRIGVETGRRTSREPRKKARATE